VPLTDDAAILSVASSRLNRSRGVDHDG
jgi:hypothetical protein